MIRVFLFSLRVIYFRYNLTMAGQGKALTDEELVDVMNQTGVSSFMGSDTEDDVEPIGDSESEPYDYLEIELLYDSDNDIEYFPTLEPESDDSEECEEPPPKKNKRKMYIYTPVKMRTPATAPASPATTSAAATPATTSAAVTPVIRGRRCQAVEVPPVVDFNKTSISSRSNFQWECDPQHGQSRKMLARNVMASFTPGPAHEARLTVGAEETFRLFITDAIVQECVTWTNKRIDFVASKQKTQSATYAKTESKEMLALLGVLIAAGQQQDNDLSVLEMWSHVTGCPIYRAAMSKGRFEFLISCLRFDDPETRTERQEQDKFAPIRKVWEEFIEKCTRYYVPRKNLTVDEQLLGFRGRCPFRMYIPNKPAKYGIKLVLICDASTKYMLGAKPYLGKGGTTLARDGISLGHYYTKELTRPYHGSHRNVTTDSWFTSVPLTADLLNNCGMTLVGTIRANKTEIPSEMKAKDTRIYGSSAFLFTTEMMLVSYVSKTSQVLKKMILLLSSQHTQPTIAPSGKPEVLEFYKSTKGSVDTFDHMCAVTSTSRKTRRWPLCVWYGILNAATINAYIISSENRGRTGRKIPARRSFMMEIATSLITPWAQMRMTSPNMSRQLRTLITTVLDLSSVDMATGAPGTSISDSNSPLVRCSACPNKSDRKTRHRCVKCALPKCPRHAYPVCGDCL